MPSIETTINSIDVTKKIEKGTISIQDVVTDKVNTCSFTLVDPTNRPQNGQVVEIIQTDDDNTSRILFGGIIDSVDGVQFSPGKFKYYVNCVDYQRILEYRLVAEAYTNSSCNTIINHIFNNYIDNTWGFTTTNVDTGPTIDTIVFNYVSISECIRRLAKIAGYEWYVDYEKDVHFFPRETNIAPYKIDENNDAVRNLKINWDFSEVKNQVMVHGGNYLSSPTTESFAGDGTTEEWVLNYSPHSLEIRVGVDWDTGTEKTVGVKDKDDGDVSYAYLLDYNAKTVYCNTAGGEVIPDVPDSVFCLYSYNIKVITQVINADAQAYAKSIEGGDGIHEGIIIDNSISSNDEARDRGLAEINEYAYPRISGSFETHNTGYKSGQLLTLDPPNWDSSVDNTYMITSVTTKTIGGGYAFYTIQFAKAPKWASEVIAELVRYTKLTEKKGDELIDKYTFHSEEMELNDTDHTFRLIESGTTTWGPDAQQGDWGFFDWG